jgi:hypothetical protein
MVEVQYGFGEEDESMYVANPYNLARTKWILNVKDLRYCRNIRVRDLNLCCVATNT